MKTIELLLFGQDGASEAFRHVPEKDDINCSQGSLFWLGAVDRSDEQRVQRFSKLCEQGRFDEAGEYADISEASVYAILARRADENGYRLFLLEKKPGPYAPQRCLLTKVFDDLVVTGKQGRAREFNLDASLSLKDILKNVSR
jgi:hypothetical protein